MTHVDFEQLATAAVLALGIAAVAMTVTMAGIFEPLRDRIEARSEWWGELFTCPYCFSHWLAFGVVAVFQPRPLVSPWWWVDMVASAFVLVTLASVGCGLIKKSFAE